jgi:hypothetical protein
MKPRIDLGEPLNTKAVKEALLFAGLVFGSTVALAQFDYFAPSATMEDSLCRAAFRIAMDGYVGPGVDRAKLECSQQYVRWSSELPPTEFRLTDQKITVGNTQLPRKGLEVRKGQLVIAGIGDIAFPAVHLHHEDRNVTLRFQTDKQADTAFETITEWLAR